MNIIDNKITNNNLDILNDDIDKQKSSPQSSQDKTTQSSPQSSQDKATLKKKSKKLDPTYFNDWQINCRTIDF